MPGRMQRASNAGICGNGALEAGAQPCRFIAEPRPPRRRSRTRKHAVLFPHNSPQNVQLDKYLFLPRFFLTARDRHHIL